MLFASGNLLAKEKDAMTRAAVAASGGGGGAAVAASGESDMENEFFVLHTKWIRKNTNIGVSNTLATALGPFWFDTVLVDLCDLFHIPSSDIGYLLILL